MGAPTLVRPTFSIACVLVALAACTSETTAPPPPAPPPDLTGEWQGEIVGENADFIVTIIEEAEHRLSGSGRFQVTGGSVAFSIDGVHAHPSVSFTVMATGLQDANYSGIVETDNLIRGEINGSGFNRNQLDLSR